MFWVRLEIPSPCVYLFSHMSQCANRIFLRQSHYVIKLEMRLRFILTFCCSLSESQKPVCALSLFNSKQNLTTRNMKAKIGHSVACGGAQLCGGAGSQVSSRRAVQDPDSSLWCMFRPPTPRCGPALTAFTETSGRRQVLFSTFLPISDSLHSLYIPMNYTHTQTRTQSPSTCWLLPGWTHRDAKTWKETNLKGLIYPFLNVKFIFTVSSWTCFECVEAIKEGEGVREREIMFTDSNVTKPGG